MSSPTTANPLLRTAGGHLHIGFGHMESVTKKKSREVIQSSVITYWVFHIILLDKGRTT